MKKRKDIRSMMMLMILIAIPTCGKLSYSRILSMATLSLSRLHIIRTVQLKIVKRYENTKNIRTVQMKKRARRMKITKEPSKQKHGRQTQPG